VLADLNHAEAKIPTNGYKLKDKIIAGTWMSVKIRTQGVVTHF